VDIINGRVASVSEKKEVQSPLEYIKFDKLIKQTKELIGVTNDAVTVKTGEKVLTLTEAQTTGLVKTVETNTPKLPQTTQLASLTDFSSLIENNNLERLAEAIVAEEPEIPVIPIPTPEPAAALTQTAQNETSVPPSLSADDKIKLLDSWQLLSPSPDADIWRTDEEFDENMKSVQKLPAPLSVQFISSEPTRQNNITPDLLLLANEKEVARIFADSQNDDTDTSSGGRVSFTIPGESLHLVASGERKTTLRLAWPETNDDNNHSNPESTTSSTSHQLRLRSIGDLKNRPLVINSSKWNLSKKTPKSWLETPPLTNENPFSSIITDRKNAATIIANGRVGTPFSISYASKNIDDGTHFLKNGVLVSSVPFSLETTKTAEQEESDSQDTPSLDTETMKKWATLTDANLVFSGKRSQLMPQDDVTSLSQGKAPPIFLNSPEVFPYFENRVRRFQNKLLTAFPQIRSLVASKSQVLFLSPPDTIWDVQQEKLLTNEAENKMPQTGEQTFFDSPLDLRTTVMRIKKNMKISFPTPQQVLLFRQNFLKPMSDSDIKLGLSVNGEHAKVLLDKDILKVFEFLESQFENQVLIVVQEEEKSTHIQIATRTEKKELKIKQARYHGRIPANWFSELTNIDGFVAERQDNFVILNEPDPCQIGNQAVLFGDPNVHTLFTQEDDFNPNAVVECVGPTKTNPNTKNSPTPFSNNAYKIVWEATPLAVKRGSRVRFPN
jgi:hypothetical protein